MLITKKIDETREIIKKWKSEGLTIGFVPTMGYLHDGHKSLIDRAAKENDKVVVSIFVNPIQFCEGEDYDRYPRDMEHDTEICEKSGVSLIFYPEVKEMYPSKNLAFVDIKVLGDNLCGASRKGHFQGVCTVVAKLFNIVKPDRAYFGEKDAQQLAIIKQMVFDLNFDLEIIPCPIVREKDGLAMSSRNSYLTLEERKAALVLSRSLELAKKEIEKGERDSEKIKNIIISEISGEPLVRIDYVEVVDADTLGAKPKIEGRVLTAIAVFIGKTRLIDNFTCEIN